MNKLGNPSIIRLTSALQDRFGLLSTDIFLSAAAKTSLFGPRGRGWTTDKGSSEWLVETPLLQRLVKTNDLPRRSVTKPAAV